MKWGISFNIAATHESDLWGLPPPSQRETVQRWDGTQMINVLYHFVYSPQSWKEWQRVASIKVQIARKSGSIEFQDYAPVEVDGKIYTIAELGRHFKGFVKFPQPQFPERKKEAYKMLCRHAKRLHYDGLLHVEQLIATSIRFNATDSEGISQTAKRAFAAYKYAQEYCEEWPTKLSKDELVEAHKKGAEKTNQQKRDKVAIKREEAKILRKEGKTLSDIAKGLGVSLRTVSNYLK